MRMHNTIVDRSYRRPRLYFVKEYSHESPLQDCFAGDETACDVSIASLRHTPFNGVRENAGQLARMPRWVTPDTVPNGAKFFI